MLEFWGNAEYLFIAIAPRSTLTRSGKGPIYGLNSGWSVLFYIFKLRSYAELNCLK